MTEMHSRRTKSIFDGAMLFIFKCERRTESSIIFELSGLSWRQWIIFFSRAFSYHLIFCCLQRKNKVFAESRMYSNELWWNDVIFKMLFRRSSTQEKFLVPKSKFFVSLTSLGLFFKSFCSEFPISIHFLFCFYPRVWWIFTLCAITECMTNKMINKNR